MKAVLAALEPHDECIVVDSASIDPRVREVAEARGVTCVRADAPGASLARNIGWRRAEHDLIAFIDDDVLVDEQWAKQLKASFDEFPDAAFVTGRIDRPAVRHGEYFAPSTDHASAATIDADAEFDPGHSANLAVRRSALEGVAGFDELLGAGAMFRAAEDKDLFDRLIANGLRGRYEPAAVVTHSDWREREHALRLHWGYGLGSGARLAKLMKIDRSRARRVSREVLWEWGLHNVYDNIRRRYRFFIVLSIVRTAGMLTGLVRAMPRKVVRGHFQPR